MATVTLLPQPPDYYPEHIWDGAPAWYVGRFTVTRSLVGRGVGEHLLNQLEIDAADAGIHALRLDVAAATSFLQ